MEFLNVLTRDEMKNVKGGSGGCPKTLTCPSGRTYSCDGYSHCHLENDGEYTGYLNCGVGFFQVGCWQHEPQLE